MSSRSLKMYRAASQPSPGQNEYLLQRRRALLSTPKLYRPQYKTDQCSREYTSEKVLHVLDARSSADSRREVALVHPRANLGVADDGMSLARSPTALVVREQHAQQHAAWGRRQAGGRGEGCRRTSSIFVLSNGYCTKRVIGRASENMRMPAGARRGRTARRLNISSVGSLPRV